MSKVDLVIFIVILILITLNANADQTVNEEWKVNRLLSPTFSEVQSEAVYSMITDYGCIDDEIVDLALNKHFERIEYMTFEDCNLEEK